MPRGPKLPKDQLIRDVPVLFPNATLEELSPDLEQFYRLVQKQHGKYYFGIDRQSDRKELARKDATGQIRRVEGILAFADVAQAWAPTPKHLGGDRAEDAPPYLFDRRFWFVDGEKKNATGLCANPTVRPEFWRAYLLTRALGAKGIGPSAFIIGEGTRFFRDSEWLGSFCRSLWDVGIEVYIVNFGKVDPRTLPGLQSVIAALSEWLPMALKGARAARKNNNRIFHGNPPFGLRFSEDKSQVFAHPEEWPILAELVEGIAVGQLRTFHAAVVWLHAHRGIQRTEGWLGQLLRSRLFEGIYDTYKTTGRPRQVRQRPFTDLDVSAGGYRRYLKTNLEPKPFIINFDKYGMSPISPAVLARARARILNKGGRPQQLDTRNERLFLGQGLVRCAVCGMGVRETTKQWKKGTSYYLACQCVETLCMRHSIDRSQARQMEEAQHVRHATLSGYQTLSERVWSMLVRETEEYSPAPRESAEADTSERQRLEEEIEGLNTQVSNLVDSLMTMRLTDEMRRQIEARQLSLTKEINERQRQLNTLTTHMIERGRRNPTMCEFREVLREFHRDGLPHEMKCEFVATLVDQVIVHLEEGWFEVRLDASLPTPKVLRGKLAEGESRETESASSTRTMRSSPRVPTSSRCC
jgi:hypothetical protein